MDRTSIERIVMASANLSIPNNSTITKQQLIKFTTDAIYEVIKNLNLSDSCRK